MNIEILAILKPALCTRRRALIALARWGCVAVCVLGFVQWNELNWRFALDKLFGQGPNAGLAAEARRLNLTYEAALADPKAAIGKPVVWCVDHPNMDYAYAGGKPSQPLHLQDASAFPINSPTTGGRCDRVLAVVTDVKSGAVTLRFVELR